ncbi:hypothetical protein J6590_097047, partial [Homalodisca vitripennis]
QTRKKRSVEQVDVGIMKYRLSRRSEWSTPLLLIFLRKTAPTCCLLEHHIVFQDSMMLVTREITLLNGISNIIQEDVEKGADVGILRPETLGFHMCLIKEIDRAVKEGVAVGVVELLLLPPPMRKRSLRRSLLSGSLPPVNRLQRSFLPSTLTSPKLTVPLKLVCVPVNGASEHLLDLANFIQSVHNDTGRLLDCKFQLFICDIKIFQKYSLQANLNNVVLSCEENAMRLNAAKCQVWTFGRSTSLLPFDYYLHGELLERVNTRRFLRLMGVTSGHNFSEVDVHEIANQHSIVFLSSRRIALYLIFVFRVVNGLLDCPSPDTDFYQTSASYCVCLPHHNPSCYALRKRLSDRVLWTAPSDLQEPSPLGNLDIAKGTWQLRLHNRLLHGLVEMVREHKKRRWNKIEWQEQEQNKIKWQKIVATSTCDAVQKPNCGSDLDNLLTQPGPSSAVVSYKHKSTPTTQDKLAKVLVPSPFKKDLFWPGTPSKKKNVSKRKREKLPAVITSKEWLEFEQKKRERRKQEELKKAERKKAREEKKNKIPDKPQKISRKKLVFDEEEDWTCKVCDRRYSAEIILNIRAHAFGIEESDEDDDELVFYCHICANDIDSDVDPLVLSESDE